jgi:hypothetical protein
VLLLLLLLLLLPLLLLPLLLLPLLLLLLLRSKCAARAAPRAATDSFQAVAQSRLPAHASRMPEPDAQRGAGDELLHALNSPQHPQQARARWGLYR